MLRNKVLNRYGFDRMPRMPISIKIPSGTSYDPATGRQSETYATVQTFAYVGPWNLKEITTNMANRINEKSRKVVVWGLDVPSDAIVEIDGDEYSIDYIQNRNDYVVLGVNPK